MMDMDKPLIYEGVLARPGIHRNPRTGKDEKITWEELKRQHMLYKRFPIIVSGAEHHGLINPSIAVGAVESRLDDANQTLRAQYIIFREQEAQDRIPEDVKRKLAAGSFVPASMTYTASVDEQGAQRGRKPDHVAIGVKNPMHEKIGIHAEEELPDNLRWEDTEGIGEAPEPEPTIELTEAKLQSIIDKAVTAALEARPLPVETASPKEEPVKEEAPKEEVVTAKPVPAPDVGLPAAAPAPKTSEVKGITELDDGWWKIG